MGSRRSWVTLAGALALPAVLAFCKAAGPEEVSFEGAQANTVDAGADADLGDTDEDVVAYAELCKRELEITQPLPAMSCLAGTEVPITIDGKKIDESNYASLATGGCDKPQWLESACYNYDHIQRIDVGNPDVEAVLNCRQKYWTNPLDKTARAEVFARSGSVEDYKLLTEFNDLGFILRNKKNGKSCFFTIFGPHFYGAYLPPPDQKAVPPEAEVLAKIDVAKPPAEYPKEQWYRDARATYFSPSRTAGGGCVGCHDLGPWKHSPFIDQVDIVPSNRRGAYFPVGKVFQASFSSLDVTTDPIEGDAQRCTSCHRMAAGGRTCDKFIDWSVGGYPGEMSATGRSWPHAAWMPEGHQDDAGAWDRDNGKHVKRLKCCCENPTAKGCRSRAFGPTKEALGPGLAEGVLPPWVRGGGDAGVSCLD